MIKYLFFDFDGTISDARSIAVKSVIKTLDEFDYKYDVKKAVDLLGIKMHRILRALNIPEKDLKKVRKRFYKHFIGGAKKGQIKLCVSVKPLKEMAKEIPQDILDKVKATYNLSTDEQPIKFFAFLVESDGSLIEVNEQKK